MKVINTQTGRICKDVAGFHLIHSKKSWFSIAQKIGDISLDARKALWVTRSL